VVEALGGALSFAVFEVLVRNEPVLGRALAIYGADLAFCLGLVAAAFIDAEHMYLPDSITIGGVVLGLGTCSLRGMGFYEALLGTVAGFVGVWLPFIVMYRWVRGVPGMGLGDAKLVALAGAWFGVLGAVVVLFAGAVQGTLAALVLYATRGNLEEPKAVREDREALERAAALGDDDARKALADDPLGTAPEPGLLRARLPFGPFLVLACLEFLFLGAWFRGRYFGLFF
jgi:leader peptidase (prepilin peptidase)/N-methyltransferase